MSAVMLGLLAETSIHAGVGRTDGPVDLPVAREGGTGYPYVPGSGVKGALRDHARFGGKKEDWVYRFFGKSTETDKSGNAGALLVGDMRLLLLPVRSLSSVYRWLTCPFMVERFWRDLRRAGYDELPLKLPAMDLSQVGELPAVVTKGNGNLFLEERLFATRGPICKDIVDLIGKALPDEAARKRLPEQLALVSDESFGWFSENALPVSARNVLMDKDPEEGTPPTKTSKNLWYEETLPPDTVMTLMFAGRAGDAKALEEMSKLLKERPYLQVGGNETVGQGWFLTGPVDVARSGGGGDDA